MRTTLDIDQDILQVAKEIARSEKSTAGKVLSDLARRGFTGGHSSGQTDQGAVRNGVEMLPRRGEPVTVEHVQRLMDKEGV